MYIVTDAKVVPESYNVARNRFKYHLNLSLDGPLLELMISLRFFTCHTWRLSLVWFRNILLWLPSHDKQSCWPVFSSLTVKKASSRGRFPVRRAISSFGDCALICSYCVTSFAHLTDVKVHYLCRRKDFFFAVYVMQSIQNEDPAKLWRQQSHRQRRWSTTHWCPGQHTYVICHWHAWSRLGWFGCRHTGNHVIQLMVLRLMCVYARRPSISWNFIIFVVQYFTLRLVAALLRETNSCGSESFFSLAWTGSARRFCASENTRQRWRHIRCHLHAIWCWSLHCRSQIWRSERPVGTVQSCDKSHWRCKQGQNSR